MTEFKSVNKRRANLESAVRLLGALRSRHRYDALHLFKLRVQLTKKELK